MYKVNFENDLTRVMEVTFKPGDKIPEHSHPDHFVYVLEAGQLTNSKTGVAPNVVDLTKGQVIWIPAESHWAQNTGKTQVRLLVTELKPTAPPFFVGMEGIHETKDERPNGGSGLKAGCNIFC